MISFWARLCAATHALQEFLDGADHARVGRDIAGRARHLAVRLPWGGVRDSGFGREHGTAAIENFTEPKAVWMNLNV